MAAATAVQDQSSVASLRRSEDERVAVCLVAAHPVEAHLAEVLPVGAVPAEAVPVVAVPAGVLPVEVVLAVDPWEGHHEEEVVCRVEATPEGALPVVGGAVVVVVVVVAAQHQGHQSDWPVAAGAVARLPWG